VAIRLEDKKQIVSEVNQAASSALSAVLADYRGVTVSQMTALRKNARDNNVYLRVVRNTLLKKAVEATDFECIQEVLVGPTILAFSQDDPGAAARVLKDFAKENDKFEIRALSVGGKLLDASQIDVLAKTADSRPGSVYAYERDVSACNEACENHERGSLEGNAWRCCSSRPEAGSSLVFSLFRQRDTKFILIILLGDKSHGSI